MQDDELNQHLSQISTHWTALMKAHQGPTDAASAAQQRLLQRYGPAVYRYLFASARDRDVADELFQEFALRFVRGDFRRADPQRGRFRNFLKTTLYHLIVDHHRQQQRRFVPLPEEAQPADEVPAPAASDAEFLTLGRAEIMARTWEALAKHDRETGQHLHLVLRFRTDHSELRSPQMAERLAVQLGRSITPEWIRKRLHLAREKFTDLLLEQVALSLPHATVEELEQELADLKLLDYCRPALARRGQSS